MKYRVYGDKVHKYYIDINSESDDDAMMAAKYEDSHNWSEIETDYSIEPYEIELINDSFTQLEIDNLDI
jgi:hypothetical protein